MGLWVSGQPLHSALNRWKYPSAVSCVLVMSPLEAVGLYYLTQLDRLRARSAYKVTQLAAPRSATSACLRRTTLAA